MNTLAELLSNRFLLTLCLCFSVFRLAESKPRPIALLETMAVMAWAMVFSLLFPRFMADLSLQSQTFILFDSQIPLFLGVLFLLPISCLCDDFGPMAGWALLAALIADSTPFSMATLAGGTLSFSASEGLANGLVFLLPLLPLLSRERRMNDMTMLLGLCFFWGVIPAMIITLAVHLHEQPVCMEFRTQTILAVSVGLLVAWLENMGFRPLTTSLVASGIMGAFFLIQPRSSLSQSKPQRFIWNPHS